MYELGNDTNLLHEFPGEAIGAMFLSDAIANDLVEIEEISFENDMNFTGSRTWSTRQIQKRSRDLSWRCNN